jgi:hypothetical protein
MALIPPNEYQVIATSVAQMVEALDNSSTVSSDVPDTPAAIFGERISDGVAGRPSVNIDPSELAVLSSGRTTLQQVATIYNCSTRTIRRRLLEFGLAEPGPPVYVDEEQADGSTTRTYHAGARSDLSKLTDEELDRIMLSIYEQFPTFGRRMIDGYLLQLGERVPRSRIEASYLRVIGTSSSSFGTKRIQRRVYSVPGPGSLWHHDGQHGWCTIIYSIISTN